MVCDELILIFCDSTRPCFPQNAVADDRYRIVCDGCGVECKGCTITDCSSIPVCSELLDHADSQGGTATLETLLLYPGYWRATNTSRNIVACFNKRACAGGKTGNPEYCSAGYTGPCEQHWNYSRFTTG